MRRYVAHPRHPLTGRQFTVAGRTERELSSYLHRIDSLRQDFRLGLVSPADVDRALRRLRFGHVTLERAARSYVRRPDLAANTRDRVESAIRSSLRELAGEELDALDGPRLSKHFDKLAARLAQRSLKTVWRTLRAIVRHAAERGWTARVPWGTWRPRLNAGRQGKALRECARNEHELERLFAAARTLDAEGPYRALEAKIVCAARLGLRQGELAGLRAGDLHPERRTVSIVRQWDGRPIKTLRAAELEAPAELFQVLGAHWTRMTRTELASGPWAFADASDPLFPAPGGGHYAHGECLSTRDLRACVRLACLNKCTAWSPHSLRDTFATLEADRHRGDLARLAERTRHRSLASLVLYLRSFERDGAGAPALAPRALPPREAPTVQK